MECKNSRCSCKDIFQTRVFKDNNYVCEINHLQLGGEPSCKNSTCVNGECVGFTPMLLWCKCNEGSVYDGTKCREAVTVDYGTNCRTPETDPIPLCDYDNLMRCNSHGTCGCYENLVYDAEDKTCITQEKFVKKFPEKIKAGPHEFCGITSDNVPKVCESIKTQCEKEECMCIKDYFYDAEDKTCITQKTYVKKFPEKVKAGLDEFCGVSYHGVPKVCDATKMGCESRVCKCNKEFYPSYSFKNGEHGTCESKAVYAMNNNLTSYRVMKGLYCDTDDECISGLTCDGNKCACLDYCVYDNATNICDCDPSWLTILGSIGGIGMTLIFVIIALWRCKKKTIYNRPARNEHHPSIPSTKDSIPPSAVSNHHYPGRVPYKPTSAPGYPSAPIGFAAPSAPSAPSADVVQDPPPSYNETIKDQKPSYDDAIWDPTPFAKKPTVQGVHNVLLKSK